MGLQRAVCKVRAPSFNTVKRAIVALLLAIVAAASIAACGGVGATALLNDTFQSGKPIESGRIDLTFALSGKGSSAVEQPLKVHLTGPFEGDGGKKLPKFALKVDLEVGGKALAAGIASVANRFYIELEGAPFVAPSSTGKALQKGYAEATKAASGSKSSFATLGIEPGQWLQNPVEKGEATIDGEKTIHIEASIDAARFLQDIDRLSGATSSLGAATGKASSLLSPKLVKSLAKSITSAHVQVYTGASDHLLRRLTIDAKLKPNAEASSALQGVTSASLHLDLTLSAVNQPQHILAPSGAKPLSDLLGTLKSLGLVGTSSAEGEGSRSEGAASGEGANGQQSKSSIPPAYVECLTKAGSNVTAQQRCAPLLKG